MIFNFPVRVTRAKRCKEGFFLMINGSRMRFNRRNDAIAAVLSWLELQRVEICSVRQYVARHQKQIERRMPKV